MQFEIARNRDFWSGVMMIVTGAVAIVIARNYDFGTTLRMGPGYFPTVLGAMLIGFGLYLIAVGLRSNEKIEGSWSIRALIMLPLSLVLFGFLMDRAGFIPALIVLIFGSALASTEFNFLEILLLTVFLVIFSVLVFVWGIGLPYPLLVGL
jgi:hypothetical protein